MATRLDKVQKLKEVVTLDRLLDAEGQAVSVTCEALNSVVMFKASESLPSLKPEDAAAIKGASLPEQFERVIYRVVEKGAFLEGEKGLVRPSFTVDARGETIRLDSVPIEDLTKMFEVIARLSGWGTDPDLTFPDRE